MIVATGVDLVEVQRVRLAIDRQGERFLARVFTAAEREACARRPHPEASLAGRFAAKEAVMKCLGTGWGAGVGFGQIEVIREPAGALSVRLRGRAAEIATARGARRWHLTLSHTTDHAVAFAVAEA